MESIGILIMTALVIALVYIIYRSGKERGVVVSEWNPLEEGLLEKSLPFNPALEREVDMALKSDGAILPDGREKGMDVRPTERYMSDGCKGCCLMSGFETSYDLSQYAEHIAMNRRGYEAKRFLSYAAYTHAAMHVSKLHEMFIDEYFDTDISTLDRLHFKPSSDGKVHLHIFYPRLMLLDWMKKNANKREYVFHMYYGTKVLNEDTMSGNYPTFPNECIGLEMAYCAMVEIQKSSGLLGNLEERWIKHDGYNDELLDGYALFGGLPYNGDTIPFYDFIKHGRPFSPRQVFRTNATNANMKGLFVVHRPRWMDGRVFTPR